MSDPIITTALPYNGRVENFDPEGSEDVLGSFAVLPIPVPDTVRIWTGDDGRPLVMWADDKRIRPCDFATVQHAVEQFNRDFFASHALE